MEGSPVGLPQETLPDRRGDGSGRFRGRQELDRPARLPVCHPVGNQSCVVVAGRQGPVGGFVGDRPRIVQAPLHRRRLPRIGGKGTPVPRGRGIDGPRRDRRFEVRFGQPHGLPDGRQPRCSSLQPHGGRGIRRGLPRIHRRPRQGFFPLGRNEPGRRETRVARSALSDTHHGAGVPHAVPRPHIGTPAVRSQASQLLREAGRRPEGPAAAFLQGGKAGVQGKDRGGTGRPRAAPPAVSVDRDPPRTPDRDRLPVAAPPLLHDRLVPEGPPGFHPPDGRRHKGGTGRRQALRGAVLDAHCKRGGVGAPGLCPAVDLSVAPGSFHPRAHDRSRNGDRAHAGPPAGPKSPARTSHERCKPRQQQQHHAQRLVLWMQKGGIGLHLPGRARGLPPGGHAEGTPRGLFTNRSEQKGICPAPVATKLFGYLRITEGPQSLRICVRGRQDGTRRDRDPERNSSRGKQRIDVTGRRIELPFDPL
mmetsp:Transcript_5561/g.11831  ORF Transcript_5561/g.11831 Transcript_5561/m.11831 type:complete len:476 (-) Transcript_5561:941-2368(-)